MNKITQLSKEQIAAINKTLRSEGLEGFNAKQLKAINDVDVLGIKALAGINVRGVCE